MDYGKIVTSVLPALITALVSTIAMITGKKIDEVIKDMKTSGPISIEQLIEILDFYGLKYADRNRRSMENCQKCSKQQPFFCLRLRA